MKETVGLGRGTDVKETVGLGKGNRCEGDSRSREGEQT